MTHLKQHTSLVWMHLYGTNNPEYIPITPAHLQVFGIHSPALAQRLEEAAHIATRLLGASSQNTIATQRAKAVHQVTQNIPYNQCSRWETLRDTLLTLHAIQIMAGTGLRDEPLLEADVEKGDNA